ncbi:hypothetical protein ACMCNP_06770 [Candidatus Acidulodesulfobacterium sp. H_13]|uniref:hypothetical protein n=1 Tax=Candidatus Acidulodesulfobacterium sp. H_13 TaxID=3395470 RepID=UPI003AF673E7
MTLKLIADYGAIGGKTIFKPSEIEHKNTKFHHRDFGILARDEHSNLPTEKIQTDEVVPYIEKFRPAIDRLVLHLVNDRMLRKISTAIPGTQVYI